MNALVISHLHYPAILVKSCCDRAKYDSFSDLKLKHNILPVTIFLEYKTFCHFWKIQHQFLPTYNNIEYENHQIDINTRNKSYISATDTINNT